MDMSMTQEHNLFGTTYLNIDIAESFCGDHLLNHEKDQQFQNIQKLLKVHLPSLKASRDVNFHFFRDSVFQLRDCGIMWAVKMQCLPSEGGIYQWFSRVQPTNSGNFYGYILWIHIMDTNHILWMVAESCTTKRMVATL